MNHLWLFDILRLTDPNEYPNCICIIQCTILSKLQDFHFICVPWCSILYIGRECLLGLFMKKWVMGVATNIYIWYFYSPYFNQKFLLFYELEKMHCGQQTSHIFFTLLFCLNIRICLPMNKSLKIQQRDILFSRLGNANWKFLLT